MDSDAGGMEALIIDKGRICCQGNGHQPNGHHVMCLRFCPVPSLPQLLTPCSSGGQMMQQKQSKDTGGKPGYSSTTRR